MPWGSQPGRSRCASCPAPRQLLHFAADAGPAPGPPGGGIAGIKPRAGEQAVFFGARRPGGAEGSVVVTVSGSSTALPGTEPGAVKVAPFSEYPAKGRATGGVRAHRFLKGEDGLLIAWVGAAPARAAAASGAPVDLPEAHGRRDGSGRARAASRSPGSPARWVPVLPPGTRPAVWQADRHADPRRYAPPRRSVALAVSLAMPLGASPPAAGRGRRLRTSRPTPTTTARRRPRRCSRSRRTTLDETSGVELSLTTDALPDGVSGITERHRG